MPGPDLRPNSSPPPADEIQPFLDEGRGVVAALTTSAAQLQSAPRQVVATMAPFAHRLSGSAALYGVEDVAELAAALERALHALTGAEESRVVAVAELMREAAAGLAAGLEDAADPSRGEHGSKIRPGLLDELRGIAASDDRLTRRLVEFRTGDPDVAEFFLVEAREKTEELAGVVADAIAARTTEEERSAVESLRRLIHSLKGTAYMVECEPLGDLAHLLEDLLRPVVEGSAAAQGEVAGALEDGIDLLLRMLAVLEGGSPAVDAPFQDLKAKVKRLTTIADGKDGSAVAALAPAEPDRPARTEPPISAEESAPPPATLLAGAPPAWTEQGSTSPAAGASIRVGLSRIDHLVNLVGELVVSRNRLGYHFDRLGEVEELVGLSQERLGRVAEAVELGALGGDAGSAGRPANGQLLPGRWGQSGGGSEGERRLRSDGSEADLSSAEVRADLELHRFDDLALLGRQLAEISFDIRESFGRLDTLRRDLGQELEGTEKLLRNLRAGVGRARLQSLRRLFRRFEQQVERFARDKGQPVRLEMQGEQVEVDTAVVERIADPLLHLVTNALVHGVESADVRRAAGKPEEAVVALRAHLRGGFVEIEVEDDGRGLSPEFLRQRAVESGLLDAEEAARLSASEALELIFLPGFSTASEVTESAGRGIGMDVVATVVTGLKGQIRTETEAGQGTRFTLRLPAGLVVSRVLRVRVGAERFALPSLNVLRLLEVPRGEMTKRDGREWITVDGKPVEVIRLADDFGISDDSLALASPIHGPKQERRTVPVAVVQVAPSRVIALAVDELVRLEEEVVQGLGDFLAGLPGIGGLTLRPDGSVGLVLDPTTLPSLSDRSSASRTARAQASRLTLERARRRILVADDSYSVRQVLSRRLDSAGFEVLTVRDGEQALEALRQPGDRPFAALVTDLEMPMLNGYELLSIVRRRPETRELPVVVVTTRVGTKHRDEAFRLGASAYMGKPVDFIELAASLERLTAPVQERTEPA